MGMPLTKAFATLMTAAFFGFAPGKNGAAAEAPAGNFPEGKYEGTYSASLEAGAPVAPSFQKTGNVLTQSPGECLTVMAMAAAGGLEVNGKTYAFRGFSATCEQASPGHNGETASFTFTCGGTGPAQERLQQAARKAFMIPEKSPGTPPAEKGGAIISRADVTEFCKSDGPLPQPATSFSPGNRSGEEKPVPRAPARGRQIEVREDAGTSVLADGKYTNMAIVHIGEGTYLAQDQFNGAAACLGAAAALSSTPTLRAAGSYVEGRCEPSAGIGTGKGFAFSCDASRDPEAAGRLAIAAAQLYGANADPAGADVRVDDVNAICATPDGKEIPMPLPGPRI